MKLTNSETYMYQCFELARQHAGNTSPNPLVGSVIVKNGKVIAAGSHKASGTDHAELDAIKNSTESVKDATLYCNLEPCCHTNKKTAPCAQRIIDEGISEVIISNLDPNPNVSGKGLELLNQAGIKTSHGVLKEEGIELNKVFFTNMILNRPYIHLKWAQTIDGKVATKSGDSKWITNELARNNVHIERSHYDAILVGANTVKADDPSLTIRIEGQETYCKKRIVIGNEKPLESKLFNDIYKNNSIHKRGDLHLILKELYDEGICSIYVEGGSNIHSQFLEQNLYDEVSIYTAAKILGRGLSIDFKNSNKMEDSINLENVSFKFFQDNILTNSRKSICLPG